MRNPAISGPGTSVYDGNPHDLFRSAAEGRPIDKVSYEKPPLLYHSDNAKAFLERLLQKRQAGEDAENARARAIDAGRLEKAKA